MIYWLRGYSSSMSIQAKLADWPGGKLVTSGHSIDVCGHLTDACGDVAPTVFSTDQPPLYPCLLLFFLSYSERITAQTSGTVVSSPPFPNKHPIFCVRLQLSTCCQDVIWRQVGRPSNCQIWLCVTKSGWKMNKLRALWLTFWSNGLSHHLLPSNMCVAKEGAIKKDAK